MKNLLFITLILCVIDSYGQKKVAGEYKSNFAPYGICTVDLKINQDSTCQYLRRFDIFSIEYQGKWHMSKDTAILIYNKTIAPKGLFENADSISGEEYPDKYLYKRNRLYTISNNKIDNKRIKGYFHRTLYKITSGKVYYVKNKVLFYEDKKYQ